MLVVSGPSKTPTGRAPHAAFPALHSGAGCGDAQLVAPVNWMVAGKWQHFVFDDLLLSSIYMIPISVLLVKRII